MIEEWKTISKSYYYGGNKICAIWEVSNYGNQGWKVGRLKLKNRS